MTKKLIIGHIGWFAHGNFGDDLMTHIIHYKLNNVFEDPSIRLWSHERPLGLKQKWFYPFNLRSQRIRDLWAPVGLMGMSSLIIGGGSILHTENSIRWKLKAIEQLKRQNRKAKSVGVNLSLGPFENKNAEKLCLDLISKLDGISLRDDDSFKWATQTNGKNVIKGFDIVAKYIRDKKFSQTGETNTLALVLMKPLDHFDKTHKENLLLVQNVLKRFEKINLVSFSEGTDLSDYAYQCALYEELSQEGREKLSFIRYQDDMDDFLAKFAQHSYVITNRFHGNVLSYLFGIPFISLCFKRYFKKNKDFMEMVESQEDQYFVYDNETKLDVPKLLECIKHQALIPKEDFFARSEACLNVLNLLNDAE